MHIASTVLLTFPPRALTNWERETLRGWVEAVDGFTAFVAERRSDDPAIYRRIVIARRRTKQHAYTIHTPQGMDVWIVVSAAEGEDVGTFPTVRAAPHAVGMFVVTEEEAAAIRTAFNQGGEFATAADTVTAVGVELTDPRTKGVLGSAAE